jgi:transposase
MTITHTEINKQRRLLEKERREVTKKLMEEYDKTYYARMKEIREECGKLGHNFLFSHFGPVGHPWSYCTYCGASKVEGIAGNE